MKSALHRSAYHPLIIPRAVFKMFSSMDLTVQFTSARMACYTAFAPLPAYYTDLYICS